MRWVRIQSRVRFSTSSLHTPLMPGRHHGSGSPFDRAPDQEDVAAPLRDNAAGSTRHDRGRELQLGWLTKAISPRGLAQDLVDVPLVDLGFDVQGVDAGDLEQRVRPA